MYGRLILVIRYLRMDYKNMTINIIIFTVAFVIAVIATSYVIEQENAISDAYIEGYKDCVARRRVAGRADR